METTDKKAMLRSLYFGRNLILFLLGVLITVVLAYVAWKVGGVEKDILIAVATSLVASAAFTYMQAILTGLSQDAVIKETVTEAIFSAIQPILTASQQHNKDFLPSRIFPAATEPDLEFNRCLTSELTRSKTYYFLGVTGRYAIARIAANTKLLDEAHIVIADPKGFVSVDHRVRHVSSLIKGSGEYATERSRIVDAVFDTVAGASKASLRCKRLFVHLIDEPIIDRFELFDHSVFVTMYSDDQKANYVFPRTLYFNSDSAVFRIVKNQIVTRDFAKAKTITLSPQMTDGAIAEAISALGYEISPDEFNSYKKRFERFYSTTIGVLNRE